MFEKKHHVYVDEQERRIILHSIVELKNSLAKEGRYPYCLDELILKVTNAPVRKLKV